MISCPRILNAQLARHRGSLPARPGSVRSEDPFTIERSLSWDSFAMGGLCLAGRHSRAARLTNSPRPELAILPARYRVQGRSPAPLRNWRSEEHTSELQSLR